MKLYKNTQVEAINQAINNIKEQSFIVQVSCKSYGNYDVKVYYDITDNTINICTIAVEGDKRDWYSPTTYRFSESGLDDAFRDLTAIAIV
jgi:hypothetical protein